MGKKSVQKSPFSNSYFHSLTKATKEITKDRSDSVASLGIVGLVICFITLIVVGGIVLSTTYKTNNPNPNPNTLVN